MLSNALKLLATPAGFEPATFSLEGCGATVRIAISARHSYRSSFAVATNSPLMLSFSMPRTASTTPGA
jgi:hypothetical protein